MSFITHFELTDGSTTWLVAASRKNAPKSVRGDVVVSDYGNFMDPGELDEDPVTRSYSDGYVWNPNAVRKGKDISLEFSFYATSQAKLISDYLSFERFVLPGNELRIRSFGYEKDYHVISRGPRVTNTYKGKAITCVVTFASRESY